MKIFDRICRVVLGLFIFMPILGVVGVFPAPTADMYTNPRAWQFISLLNDSKYVMYTMAFVFLICIVLIIKNRMALATLLLLPIVVNILGFHIFLDGGLLAKDAFLADGFGLLVIYFLYKNIGAYKALYNYKNY